LSALAEKHCRSCEGGVAPLARNEAERWLAELDHAWSLSADGRSLQREWRLKDFFRTMSLVNAVAHIANIEDHHPDLEIGYNYCRLRYSTHAIRGLSENDFICAAKIDRIPIA